MASPQYPLGTGMGQPNPGLGFNAARFGEPGLAGATSPVSQSIPLYQGWRLVLRKVHKKDNDQWKRFGVRDLNLKSADYIKMVARASKKPEVFLKTDKMKKDLRYELDGWIYERTQHAAACGVDLELAFLTLKQEKGKTNEGNYYEKAIMELVLKRCETYQGQRPGGAHRNSGTSFEDDSSTHSFPHARQPPQQPQVHQQHFPPQQPQVHQQHFPQHMPQPGLRPGTSYSEAEPYYEDAYANAHAYGMPPAPPPNAPMPPHAQPARGPAPQGSPIYEVREPAGASHATGYHHQPQPQRQPHAQGAFGDPHFAGGHSGPYMGGAMHDTHGKQPARHPHQAQPHLFGERGAGGQASNGNAKSNPAIVDLSGGGAYAHDKPRDKAKKDGDKGKSHAKAKDHGSRQHAYHGASNDDADDDDDRYEDERRARRPSASAKKPKARPPIIEVHQNPKSKPARRGSVHAAGSPRSKVHAWRDRASAGSSSGSDFDEDRNAVFDNDSLDGGTQPSSRGYRRGDVHIKPARSGRTAKGQGHRRGGSHAIYSDEDSGARYEQHHRRRDSGRHAAAYEPPRASHNRRPSSGAYHGLHRSASQRHSNGSGYYGGGGYGGAYRAGERGSADLSNEGLRAKEERLAEDLRAAKRQQEAERRRAKELYLAEMQGELQATMAETERQRLETRRRGMRGLEDFVGGGGASGAGGYGAAGAGGYGGGAAGGYGGGLRSPGGYSPRFDERFEEDDLLGRFGRTRL